MRFKNLILKALFCHLSQTTVKLFNTFEGLENTLQKKNHLNDYFNAQPLALWHFPHFLGESYFSNLFLSIDC